MAHAAITPTGCVRWLRTENLLERSSPIASLASIRPPLIQRYLEDFGTCLDAVTLSLSFLAALDFDCFWDACFCVAFGDLSPMVFEATHPRGGVKPPGAPSA